MITLVPALLDFLARLMGVWLDGTGPVEADGRREGVAWTGWEMAAGFWVGGLAAPPRLEYCVLSARSTGS